MATTLGLWGRAAAVLCASAVALGLLGCSGSASDAKPLHAPPNFDPTLQMYVACSRIVVEGDVIGVGDNGPGSMVTTLRVTRWVKPTSGDAVAKIVTADIARDHVYQRWPTGTHLRLVVDVDPQALPNWEFTPAMFEAIRAAAPQSSRLACPYGP